ncbi:GyrI-like domain-containing protein [Microbacterium sp. F51-2R]|uniref:GyrI-like domain-containing protein n=1 Tax=Microbacterium sp. F51-2R TaxID=3445777 RepID=UPI003FA11F57
MSKADLKKEIAVYSAPRGRFEVVDVPPLRYLMIDGHGDPNSSPEYAAAVSTLFAVAYRLKFFSKRELDRDYVVMPLEGLWWSDVMATFTISRDKSRWSWTLLNLVPEWITDEQVEGVRQAIEAGGESSALPKLRLDELAEGRSVQTLHVGSYDGEGPVLAEMHSEFIPGAGLRMTGRHHEIYLSDPRRTSPEKLKTILRQPVAEA